MHIPGPIFLLLIFCSVLEFHIRVVEHFLGFLLMDCVTCINSFLKHSSGGFLVFGSLKQAFDVIGLFLLLGCGLKVLNFGWFFKRLNGLLYDSGGESFPLRDGICAKNDLGGKCSSKIPSCKCRFLKCLEIFSPAVTDSTKLEEETDSLDFEADCCDEEGGGDDKDDEKHPHYDEDNEFDVLALRKLIKMERNRANSALLELEKERMSAATAAEESMAMILRLQNEKSSIEMESNHYKRIVEEKLLYDQDLIQSLQWLVMEHESDRSVLEDQLQLSEKKFRQFMEKGEMDACKEVEESLSNVNIEKVSDNCLYRSLDLTIVPE